MSEAPPTHGTEAEAGGRTFQIDEAALDAILDEARERADAVGESHADLGGAAYDSGVVDGSEQVHRGVIERGDLVDTTE